MGKKNCFVVKFVTSWAGKFLMQWYIKRATCNVDQMREFWCLSIPTFRWENILTGDVLNEFYCIWKDVACTCKCYHRMRYNVQEPPVGGKWTACLLNHSFIFLLLHTEWIKNKLLTQTHHHCLWFAVSNGKVENTLSITWLANLCHLAQNCYYYVLSVCKLFPMQWLIQ
jgi:hypothetical protein